MDHKKPIEARKVLITGVVCQDAFGRIYVDTCASDQEHLTTPAAPDQIRTSCRFYIENMFKELIGKEVDWMEVNVKFWGLE